ncbi:MAG: hypothetical protein AAB554_03025 [Patescibacteria group bacterium]
MEDWKLDYWQAGGFPDPDLLIGKRFRFEPDWDDIWTKARLRDGDPITAVSGVIVGHKTETRGDAHTDYVRMTLTIKADPSAWVTDAEISFDAYSISWVSDCAERGSMMWNITDCLDDHLSGRLSIL